MSDNEIKAILIERKRKQRRKETVESVLGWVLLFGGLYIWYILLHAFM